MRLFFGLCAVVSVLGCGVVHAADADKPLTGDDLKMAQAMNTTYAHHLFASSCMKRQTAYFLPKGLTDEEAAKRVGGFQKSCDCMADTVLKVANPNDVIEYITDTYGTRKPGNVDAKERLLAYKQNMTQAKAQIRRMSYDPDARRNCGFSQ